MSNLDPLIIQGGMGVGVSSWKLAQSVSRAGQLGVVSGVGLDVSGFVGINLLEKLQLSNLATLYGALLAGVNFAFSIFKIWNRALMQHLGSFWPHR